MQMSISLNVFIFIPALKNSLTMEYTAHQDLLWLLPELYRFDLLTGLTKYVKGVLLLHSRFSTNPWQFDDRLRSVTNPWQFDD